MDLVTSLLADYANIDQVGKPNVMGIFTTIHSERFPARHPAMYLVIGLRATAAEAGQTRKLTIKLLDEDGTPLLVLGPREITLPPFKGQRIEVNHIVRINHIVFEKPGSYEFRVLVNDDDKGALMFEVERRSKDNP